MSNTQQTSSLVTQVFNSRNIILDLLKTQGYDTSEYTGFDINQVNSMTTTNQLDMLLTRPARESGGGPVKTYVNYHLSKQLNQGSLQDTITDLFDVSQVLKKSDTLVVIIKEERVNETMTNLIRQVWEQYHVYISIFTLQRLQFNVTAHRAVPKHTIVHSNKMKLMKYRFNVNSNDELPKISRFDPVAMAIGLRPGEACEIIRPSKNAIQGVYYRLCTNH
jgi:DNA-directed RNA polymerase subunit H (RpoH/RPB5)